MAGNHEYYHTTNINNNKQTIDDTNSKISEITSKFANVHFLQNDSHELGNEYVVLGTTLWTNIPHYKINEIQHLMNDYTKIFYSSQQLLTPFHVNNMYQQNVEWLHNNVEKYHSKSIIILSHHLPSEQLILPRYKAHAAVCAFASNLDNFIGHHKNIKYWFCGHSHHTMNATINQCKVFINSYGYKNQNPNPQKLEYTIELN